MEASFLSMVSVIYGYLSGKEACIQRWFGLLGLFILCFAFQVHRQDGCAGENRSWMHTLIIGQVQMVLLSRNRLFYGHRQSPMLLGLQGEARHPSMVFLHRTLSQSSGKPELRSSLVLQTSIKTLDLIHNSGENQF